MAATNLPAEVAVSDAKNGVISLQNNGRRAADIVVSAQDQAGGSRRTVAAGSSATFGTNGGESLSVDGRLITRLEYRNIIQDDRPADAKVPEPQVAWVQILIDQQSYYIQIRVTYRLNEGYIADSVYAADHLNCPFDPSELAIPLAFGPLGGFVAGLLVTAVVAVLVFGVKRGGRPSGDGSRGNEESSP